MARQAIRRPKAQRGAPRAQRSTTEAAAPRARRLTAEARRHSILKAARRAFSKTGDVNGTTVRVIAEQAGISEGVIYRHFESKEQLFYEAVVEPLRDAVDSIVAASEAIDRDEPLTPERQLETLNGLYRQLISTLHEVLPLLGLVLFGDPKVATRFYNEHFSAAMDRMGAAWGEIESHYGEVETPEVAARVVMGVALILALETRHNPSRFDRDDIVARVTQGTRQGFFPPVQPARRRRR